MVNYWIRWMRVRWISLTRKRNCAIAIWKLACSILKYAAFFYSSLELLNKYIGDTVHYGSLITNGWSLLIVCAAFSLLENREKVSVSGILSSKDFQIEVVIDDIFSVDASSIVIPTNSFFITKMDKEYISAESVQGAFQNKYFKNNLETLDAMIRDSLEKQKSCLDNYIFPDINGKYPIGTVAEISLHNKHYYFLAISDVNQAGKPINQKYENVSIALQKLMRYIFSNGYCDTLAIPLIGSGRAAIADASREKILVDIINSFSSQKDKIVQKLRICINPKDYIDDYIDMSRIESYMRFKLSP